MIQMPRVMYDTIALKGGLDLVTPTLSLPPGALKDSVNYECAVTGGYTRIVGYERRDGHTAPSSVTYQILTLASFVSTPAVGDTIVGQTSAATAVVAVVTATALVVTKVTGAFTTEVVKVGATTIGTISALGGGVTSENDAVYTNAAADIYRADILAVPGSGAVRGVFFFDDVLYAFRDNVGATACVLHEETASGWSAVTLYNEVSFTAGSGSIADGQTVTRGANTATIKRVVLQSGTFEAGTAAGRLIITTPAPGSFSAGSGTTSGGGALTISGAETAITLLPGGRYETEIANFTGSAATRRVYGCDGVNRGFEFDGTVFVPVVTGASPDTPRHVAALKEHLMWAIGASVVHSAPGLPYNYQVVSGAGEIAIGADITGLAVQRGTQAAGAMAIYVRNNTSVLYGTSAADWNLIAFGTGTGAIRYSVQNMFETFAFDDRGIMSLSTTQNFGNFDQATLTSNIQRLINERRTRIVASSINREKSQYRVFFNDGYGLYLTILNGKYLGAGPVSFAHIASCSCSGETSAGESVSFIGSTNGYVYQLDKGTSFDGDAISASMTLNFNATKSPRMRKRYRKASIEVSGTGFAAVSFGYSLGYGTDAIDQPGATTYGSSFQAAAWDSFSWDAFIWDGRTLLPTEAEMAGTAENVAITLGSGTDYIPSYTINSIILHYSVRRGLR